MNENHLTASDVDLYAEEELAGPARAEMEKHLAICAACRVRVAPQRQIVSRLRGLPREDAAQDLAARVGTAVEFQGFQDRLRRSRLPFVVAAMFFSFIFLLWFGFQWVVALQVNGTLDFFSLLTSHPDVFSADSVDAAWALIEALPIGETALMLFALFMVILLVQQWMDTIHPRILNG